MLALIFGFFAKIGIGTIATKIADAYTAKQNATTDREKIAADERIKTLPRLLGVQYECPIDNPGASLRDVVSTVASAGTIINWKSHAGRSGADRMCATASTPLLASLPRRRITHCSNHFGWPPDT